MAARTAQTLFDEVRRVHVVARAVWILVAGRALVDRSLEHVGDRAEAPRDVAVADRGLGRPLSRAVTRGATCLIVRAMQREAGTEAVVETSRRDLRE